MNGRGEDTARSTVFELTALAMVHLAVGDLAGGVVRGNEALALAQQVRSVRTIDRLEPLAREASRHARNSDVRDLGERIATLRLA